MKETERLRFPNKPNWLMAIVIPFPLMILGLIILFFLPLSIISNPSILSIIAFLGFGFITILVFIFFLYLWLWNTFGVTYLEISESKIIVSKKYNIFYKTKKIETNEIQKIFVQNRDVESNGYSTRLNYLFSNSNQSIAIETKSKIIRLVDWLKIDDANKAIAQINKILNVSKKNIA